MEWFIFALLWLLAGLLANAITKDWNVINQNGQIAIKCCVCILAFLFLSWATWKFKPIIAIVIAIYIIYKAPNAKIGVFIVFTVLYILWQCTDNGNIIYNPTFDFIITDGTWYLFEIFRPVRLKTIRFRS